VRRHLVARVVLDEPVIESLVGRTLDGEKRARAELWLALSPVIEKIAGQWRVTGRLHDREDDRRDVFVRVMGRLEAKRFQRLGSASCTGTRTPTSGSTSARAGCG
jgi:hypothetical protein